MTPVFLLEELQKFISSKTSDIILPVRTRTGSSEEKERAADAGTDDSIRCVLWG